MASTSCFLHHHALSTPTTTTRQRQAVNNIKPNQLVVCKAAQQKQQSAVCTNVEDESNNGVMSRRLALTVLIGAAAVGSKVSPADAAYGEAANVFGKPKTNTDFLQYAGDGFKLSIPSKWNPSKEREFPGQVLRYEDNFDATSNVSVMVQSTDKKSITDFGSPEDFLSQVNYLLGKQAYFGKTDAEGGFTSDAVAVANILESSTPTIDGKPYYFLSILTRTADGDEGGKHQGHPCDIPLPDPDIYIDEIDWNSYVDLELILDLEREIANATIPYRSTPKKYEDSAVILGLHKITEEPPSCQAIFGWGDAGSNKLQEGETGNQATDNNYGRVIPHHDKVLQDNQGGRGWGSGWNNVQDHQVGWGWGSGWNNVQDNQGGWEWYNGWNNDNRYHHTPRQDNNRCQPVNNERGGWWESSLPRDSDGVLINHNKNHGCNIGSAGEAEGRYQNRGGWNQHRAWGNKREGIGSRTKADKFQLEHCDYYQAAGVSKRIYS